MKVVIHSRWRRGPRGRVAVKAPSSPEYTLSDASTQTQTHLHNTKLRDTSARRPNLPRRAIQPFQKRSSLPFRVQKPPCEGLLLIFESECPHERQVLQKGVK